MNLQHRRHFLAALTGMPIGSPGMDEPEYGGRRDRYDVLLVRKGRNTAVFAT
jgi:hypothetical protein